MDDSLRGSQLVDRNAVRAWQGSAGAADSDDVRVAGGAFHRSQVSGGSHFRDLTFQVIYGVSDGQDADALGLVVRDIGAHAVIRAVFRSHQPLDEDAVVDSGEYSTHR